MLVLFSFSCGWRESAVEKPPEADPGKEQLMGANRQLLERDTELIRKYIARRGWEMQTTSSGLYYFVYEAGEGEPAQNGDIIRMNYRLSLLDGTLCYTSDEDGPLVFRVGKGGVESGLEEAALLLRRGDKARLILPPFLAHGLTGDQNKIPPRTVIVYEVEVISVTR